MREIVDILKRYDIAGQITLVSPTHSEYLTQFPTWSLAQFETNSKGTGIRYNSKDKIFATDKGKLAAQESTVHILDQFRHNAMVNFGIMDDVIARLSEFMEIESNIRNPHPHDDAGERAAHDPRNQAGKRKNFWTT